MKRMVLLCVAVLLFAFPPSASSTLINGGFEAGDFTGWNQNVPTGGEAVVATGHSGSSGTNYLPVEGQYFALLQTDGPDNYTTISQSIDLLVGDVLTGWAAFDYRDYSPFNDNAYVHIIDDTGTVVWAPWDEYGAVHESSWDGPWTFWNFTPPQAGNYQIEFGVANNLDSAADSYALFDANVHNSGTQPVPEPTTWLLLGIGLLGVAGIGRKRFFKKS